MHRSVNLTAQPLSEYNMSVSINKVELRKESE